MSFTSQLGARAFWFGLLASGCAALDVGINDFVKRDGYYLSRASMMPIYSYVGDKSGVSRCYADCLRVFKPLLSEKPIESGDITTFKRGDGQLQMQYLGRPLYTSTFDLSGAPPRAHRMADGWTLVRY